ncbi:MAG: hypothetical protein AAFO29_11065, partial [Actinomycetota bacterium]
WGAPGQVFGPHSGVAADHGSPRTATQLAVVAGGHPIVAPLADRVASIRPQATMWAKEVASLLGLIWHPGRAVEPERIRAR